MGAQFSAVSAVIARRPVVAASGVMALKYAGCEALLQIANGRAASGAPSGAQHALDYNRVAAFTMFGAVYAGLGQYAVFNWLMPRLFRGPRLVVRTLQCTAFDQFVHMPLIYLPIFHFFLQAATAEGAVPWKELRRRALVAWREGLGRDMELQMVLFVPTQLYNFACNPPHLRVPLIAAVGVVWIMGLSMLHPAHAA
eukprot:TRINITY_DN4068_c0_g2_i1.p1 TRINITY_DN4068_c0_g2~~TRINITY_DN4068_c0_g2_i1.p1  ORF type:complete len:225 (+),score=67.86 TRINITY_DN4068_c0_g2_i1:86-676(+)